MTTVTNEETITEKQLVVFSVAGQHYGVDIQAAREIIQMQDITGISHSSDYIEGLINLRGSVIPVVDLRKRFGMELAERTDDSRIVVVSIEGENIGVIVDSVTEVLRIKSDSIELPSSMITTSETKYVLGIAKLPDRLITLLDVNLLLSHEDMMLQAKEMPQKKVPSQKKTES